MTIFLWLFFAVSIGFSLVSGNTSQLSSAFFSGAEQGISLAVTMAGPLCLWSGFLVLFQNTSLSGLLRRMMLPGLSRFFPESFKNAEISEVLSMNVLSNLLGLGNAATPAGIQVVRLMSAHDGQFKDELCRLIVLNTASIQLLPATCAALRSALGCLTPFDILPAVWCSSLGSVTTGLLACKLLSRWHR